MNEAQNALTSHTRPFDSLAEFTLIFRLILQSSFPSSPSLVIQELLACLFSHLDTFACSFPHLYLLSSTLLKLFSVERLDEGRSCVLFSSHVGKLLPPNCLIGPVPSLPLMFTSRYPLPGENLSGVFPARHAARQIECWSQGLVPWFPSTHAPSYPAP